MKIRQTRRGQTAVLFTLAIVPLFGVMGLVVDVGWSYFRKEAAQTASDAAGAAAAQAAYMAAGGGAPTCTTPGVTCSADEYLCPSTIPSPPADNLQIGCMYAQENGFVTTPGKQWVTLQSGVGAPPISGGVTVSYWVAVRVKEKIPQLFSAVLGQPTSLVIARTTTGTQEGSAGGCIITLNKTAGQSLRMTGTSSVTTGCGVFVNSNNPSNAVDLSGGGSITTTGKARTDIVGQCSGCSNINPAPRTGVPYLGDPFRDMAPPVDNGCSAGYSSGITGGSHDSLTVTSSFTNPTVICPTGSGYGIDLGAQSTLTMGSGLYIIRGGINLGAQTTLKLDPAAVAGGVTIYIESGGVNMSGGATVNLTAPSSGIWQGILFFQARDDATPSTLVGGNTQTMNGVLYFPAAWLTYDGGASTTATQTSIVSDTLTLVGNTVISAAASTSFTGTKGGVAMIE